ncbi:5-methylcytosine restriction system specificity protein McrC [Pseudoalteromonas sp. PPB1]|uniref:5-methylcytosine restriction system specificity protein McrC n=1 Tax=Pseudoalteromonas sp. PPB1 TaxID=2756136 RepID=UPI001891CF6D|nr:5-methylcytosine-specific restriction endonuclease system specificity protein McrC [Pseudoalteromonas sp. PPB1]
MSIVETVKCNTAAGIPVRNLWLLMLYASDFRYLLHQKGGKEDRDEDVANLVAEVFCSEVNNRLKRQLSYGYKRTSGELNRVRGRINTLETYSKGLLKKGKVSCAFETLSVDTARNRFILGALQRLLCLVSSKQLKQSCVSLVKSMKQHGVSDKLDRQYHPKYERFGNHEMADRKVLQLAALAFDLALINESAANQLYPSPDKQAYWVRKLFEKAVAGFYTAKLGKDWSVRQGKRLDWRIDGASELIDKLMPSMQIDMQLENLVTQRRLIIDTKYASITTHNYYGGEIFKSGYIYQLYTYLRSQECTNDPLSLTSSGMLLHPSIGEHYDEVVSIQGHDIRFCTVDLTESAAEINRQLIGLLG